MVQDIMYKVNKPKKYKNKDKYTKKKYNYYFQKNEMTYTPPEFTMPQIKMSKGHQTCYRVLQKIIEVHLLKYEQIHMEKHLHPA